ncbi:MAG: DeoR/GlpR family DNA-binding transcription regulator [Hyphomicrobiales bacterium]
MPLPSVGRTRAGAGRPASRPAAPGEARARTLIPAERQARIVEIIRRQGAASIHAIALAMKASVSTIRRDLEELTERGYLDRTHGGAIQRSRFRTTFEPSQEIAGRLAHAEKLAIARHAASLIGAGQSVAFDSSSTVLEAARAVAMRRIPLTAVTNDLRIGQELGLAEGVKVILTSGALREGSMTLVGETAIAFISRLKVDIALIGIHSLEGLRPSETSLEVAAVKRAFIASGRKVLLLADSTKFDSPAFTEIGGLELFEELVTDQGIAASVRRSVEKRGVKVTVVRPGGAA